MWLRLACTQEYAALPLKHHNDRCALPSLLSSVCVLVCYSFTRTLTGDSLETSLVEEEMRLSL